MRYHMGCGVHRLEGWTNVDLIATEATDLVTDLTHPELEAADVVFSHAFFEHLARADRVPHLRAVRQALTPDGFVCYIGLPDFRAVAQLYLERGPGIVGPVFDLFNVYRYTHGDPEMNDDEAGYYAQLHKSLFDAEELDVLLRDAGYPSYVTFGYVYPGEPVAVTIGFLASPRSRPVPELQEVAREFLTGFEGRHIEVDSLTFAGEASRSGARARVLAAPRTQLVRRVAHGLAAYLARV